MPGTAIIAERSLPDRGGLARATSRIAEMVAGPVHLLRSCAETTPGARRVVSEGDGLTEHAIGRLDREEERLRAWVEHATDVVTEHGLDRVHGVYATTAGFVATLVGAHAGVPSIVSLRGNDFDRGIYRDGLARLRLTLERATAVTAVTRVMAARAERLFSRPVSFVPNAVDTDAFRRETADNSLRASLGLSGQVIGFSGELREKKGMRFLLPAFAALARQRDLHLLLLGGVRDDAEPAWEAFVRAEPAAAARVHRLRYDDDPARLSLRLALCDVMVFPSLYEGMPNAVLEAMAAECAVVATDVGGHGELIEHGRSGALLSLRDLDRLPEAIAEMLELPPGERRRMGQAARAFVADAHSPAAERAAWQAVYATAQSD